jgi:hypothetical protein
LNQAELAFLSPAGFLREERVFFVDNILVQIYVVT